MQDEKGEKLKDLRKDDTYIAEILKRIESETLRARVAHELYTYAGRAKFYKRLYWSCFCVGLFMPLLASALQFGEGVGARLVAVVLMGSVSVSTGFLSGMKIHEKWEHNRKYCERMKYEISCCQNGIEKYSVRYMEGIFIKMEKQIKYEYGRFMEKYESF